MDATVTVTERWPWLDMKGRFTAGNDLQVSMLIILVKLLCVLLVSDLKSFCFQSVIFAIVYLSLFWPSSHSPSAFNLFNIFHLRYNQFCALGICFDDNFNFYNIVYHVTSIFCQIN